MRIGLTVAAMALAMSGVAEAAWHKAVTNQFVVYSDDTPANVAAQAKELEIFDASLKLALGLPVAVRPSPNPVSLYMTQDLHALRLLYGDINSSVAGWYSARPAGAVSFMPKRIGGRADFDSRLVLLHEYGHHFLLSNFRQAFPAWFSEGFSEFISTFELLPEGAQIGKPAFHRSDMLEATQGQPISELFKPGPKDTSMVYGRGWLITHYFMASPERRPQLDAYFRKIFSGVRDPQAATEAFGDLRQLNTQVNRYWRSNSFSAIRIAKEKLPTVNPVVTPLTAGEAAFMPYRMMSERGVDKKRAESMFVRAQAVAARYPGDANVQAWFAEAAFDAKKFDAADTAADRAIASDPNNVHALIYKGRIAMARAKANKDEAAAKQQWTASRQWIARANGVANNDAEPLALIYASFKRQKVDPSANAIAAIHRAARLMPQVAALRIASAREFVSAGNLKEARPLLAAVAFNQHGKWGAPTRKLIEELEKGTAPGVALATYDKEIEELKAKARKDDNDQEGDDDGI